LESMSADYRTLIGKVTKPREIRQFPQCETDYQSTEAGINGKSDINQMSK